MIRYRLTMTIEDELVTRTHEEAWVKFVDLIKRGYYGPTRDDVEFQGEVPEEEGIPAVD